MVGLNVSQIHQLMLKVDKEKGNQNKELDTEEEISLFTEQLEKRNVPNARKIVTEYCANSIKFEAKFAKEGTTIGDNTEYAIMAALNNGSYLHENKNLDGQADSIVDNIASAVGTGSGFLWLGWGTDEEKLEKNVNRINKTNVLRVLDKYKATKGESLAAAIVGDTSGDDLDKLGKVLINALIEKADEFKIDLTSMINIDENGNYTVLDISGVKQGESATSEDNLEKVVAALQNKIETGLSIYSGDKDKINDNKEDAMILFARQADVNGDGDLKDDEVGFFKKLCADAGIFINEMLSKMSDKTEENYTEDEKMVHNILNSNLKDIMANNAEKSDFNAKMVNGIETKNTASLDEVFTSEKITSDNVEEVLAKLTQEKTEYSYTYYGPNSGGQTVATTTSYLKKLAGIDAKYVQVILQALIDKAEENGINVGDIVEVSNGKYYTPEGKNALGTQYIDNIISKIRERIKEESDLSDIELL